MKHKSSGSCGRSNEPIWWAPFIAGGGMAAMFLPALIFVTGIAVPVGWVNSMQLANAVTHILGRLFLFVLISLCLVHWAHRFRFTLLDLGVHGSRKLIASLCYGTAIVGTLLAAWLVLTV